MLVVGGSRDEGERLIERPVYMQEESDKAMVERRERRTGELRKRI